MGLDQYAYAVMPHKDNTDFGWTLVMKGETPCEPHRLAQWRKHSNLQGWMESLWRQKMEMNGTPVAADNWQAFNCQPLRLTYADILRLEEDVKGDHLPQTSGFFFGQSQPEDDIETLDFVEDALHAIGQDMEVYYDSWW